MVNLSRRWFFKRQNTTDTVRLPWLRDPEGFVELCTQCGKCQSACETGIITRGDGGFPQIDFSINECTFCYQCATACPESLFLEQQSDPWHAKADINEHCLAKRNIECRTCGEMCDSMAIVFKPEIGKVAQPNLKLNECNGCGACVSVCPTTSINVINITA